MADNSRAINRVFTRTVIDDLLKQRNNEIYDFVVRCYIDDPKNKTHGQIISEIYAHLEKEQRNEYYYVNTLLNKLLAGIHNVSTTTALTQIRIGHHIADFIMINGEGRVYEIKSDLDRFDRLYEQLADYYTAFCKVSVLTSINELSRVKKILSSFGSMGEAVGIYVLTQNSTIFNKQRSREPMQFEDCLTHTAIFKLLRKREYEHILHNFFHELPQATPAFYFKACLNLFQQIPILEAQKLTFKELKKRNIIEKKAFDKIQSELKSVVYFSELSSKIQLLEPMLQTYYGG